MNEEIHPSRMTGSQSTRVYKYTSNLKRMAAASLSLFPVTASLPAAPVRNVSVAASIPTTAS